MRIKESAIKILWSRSGNRCAMCRSLVSADKESSGDPYPIGEQAHIVAAEPDGPRGKSPLTPEERNSYHNLVLLCPNCHTKVDKSPDDYPVEKLYILKAKHEEWVQATLAAAQPKNPTEQIYSHLIDEAVEAAMLEKWDFWSDMALRAKPWLPAVLPDYAMLFRKTMVGALWPGTNDELERALQTLSIALLAATQHFVKNSSLTHGSEYLEADSMEDPDRYQEWERHFTGLVFHVGRAANWLAEVVRRDINPWFFAVHGRFLATESDVLLFKDGRAVSGPHSRTYLCEYSAEEKTKLPASLVEALDTTKARTDE